MINKDVWCLNTRCILSSASPCHSLYERKKRGRRRKIRREKEREREREREMKQLKRINVKILSCIRVNQLPYFAFPCEPRPGGSVHLPAVWCPVFPSVAVRKRNLLCDLHTHRGIKGIYKGFPLSLRLSRTKSSFCFYVNITRTHSHCFLGKLCIVWW